uniref:16S rRNA (guanine(527)-N(7))-methyltransferase RsmG n=1 Tax=Eubacterium sp. TaxID=142586 RepID=UPI0040272C7A
MINKEQLREYAQQFSVELDDMALDRFDYLEQRLLRWNEKVNLTAITDSEEIMIKHFIDSLTVLYAENMTENAKVVDVGCGAGFPGLPILIARPDLQFTFVDSVGKKLAFIREIVKDNGLFGEGIHERAEELARTKEYRERYDYAVSRAVAPLNILAEYCIPLVKPGGMFIALKGAEDEVQLGENAVKETGGKIEKVVSLKLPNGDSRNIILIRKISQTPAKYPRKTKKITAKPL